MTTFQKITSQLSFAKTGRQEINCPECGKPMNMNVSGKKKILGTTCRDIKGGCRHCGHYFSYRWQ